MGSGVELLTHGQEQIGENSEASTRFFQEHRATVVELVTVMSRKPNS